MDPVLQAFTGLMVDNKGEDGIPHRVPFVVIDMSTALYAFQALSAALYARRDEPRGRRIEVSLLQAASAMQVIRMMMVYLEGDQRPARHAERRVQDGRRLAAVPGRARTSSGSPSAACWARPSWQPTRASPTAMAASTTRPSCWRIVRPAIAEQADRLLVGAPARSRHHARAAEHLPRVRGAAAGRGDRPHQLAAASTMCPSPFRSPIRRHRAVRRRHAARHTPVPGQHTREILASTASAPRRSPRSWSARSWPP